MAGPSPSGGTPTPSPPPSSSPSPTPGPTIRRIAFVADVGPMTAGGPNAQAWEGVQSVAEELGAASTVAVPLDVVDLRRQLEQAVASSPDVVVTLGADAAGVTAAAAQANPAIQFVGLGQVGAATGPANLQDVWFDESEAGYLAGVVAGALTRTGVVGLVGTAAGDATTASYAAGFDAGASLSRPGITVRTEYSGTANAPEKGRAAADRLARAGADVVLAVPGLAGIGALRQACTHGLRILGAGSDAWVSAPDLRPCLVASVENRYDAAAIDALRRLVALGPQHGVLLEDVATGGVALSSLHNLSPPPADLESRLETVIAAMRSGPPRPTPAPPTASPIPSAAAAGPSGSAVPSATAGPGASGATPAP